jgi:hypothetical protein
MRIVADKCPNCGANLNFNTNKNKVECEFCGSELRIIHEDNCDKLIKAEDYTAAISPAANKMITLVVVLSLIVMFGFTFFLMIYPFFNISTPIPPSPADGMSYARQMAFAEFNESDYVNLAYRDLENDTYGNIWTLVNFRGVVLESAPASIQPGICLADDTIRFYRISVAGGSEHDLLLTEVSDMTDVSGELSNGDWVDIYGVVYGRASYEAVGGHTISLPSVAAVKMDRIAPSSIVAYSGKSFNVTCEFSDAKILIDSFEITSIEKHPDVLALNYTIEGIVHGLDYFEIEVNCFDTDGVFVGSTALWSNVVEGERFRLNETFWVPVETVRIEFLRD